MKLKTFLTLLLLSGATTGAFAQLMVSKSNAVFGPMFRMINTSQEVKVSRRVTTQTTMKTRPATNLRFLNLGKINFEGQDYEPFGNTRFSAVGNVTETRIYSKKKGAFHGFYFGPYFSYMHYKLQSQTTRATFHDNTGAAFYGDVSQVIKLNVIGGGFQIGTQGMYFKDHLCIDWTIMGIGFGSLGFEGGIEAENTSENFDFRNYTADVENMRMGIEKWFDFNRTVNPTSVMIGAKIPMINIRMGLSIGFGYGGNLPLAKRMKEREQQKLQQMQEEQQKKAQEQPEEKKDEKKETKDQ